MVHPHEKEPKTFGVTLVQRPRGTGCTRENTRIYVVLNVDFFFSHPAGWK